MRFVHIKCGGEIDVEKRRCMRCKKRWSRVGFKIDATGIRPMVDSKGQLVPDKVKSSTLGGKTRRKERTGSVASWTDGIPVWVDLGLARVFANWLPRWPRWARILATLIFVGIVIYCAIILRRC